VRLLLDLELDLDPDRDKIIRAIQIQGSRNPKLGSTLDAHTPLHVYPIPEGEANPRGGWILTLWDGRRLHLNPASPERFEVVLSPAQGIH
jgi:hypothetical protein